MQQKDKTSSRKKFLLWGAAVVGSLTGLRFLRGSEKPALFPAGDKNETVKMLTREGKLVEVDPEKLYPGRREKISDEQLKNWITKK